MANQNTWRLVVTDHTYVPQGEILNAYEKNITLPLNGLDLCSFRVRLDNPQADWLMSTEGYIKAYRNDVLRFFGPVVTAQETGGANDASVAVNAVGAGWIMTKRLVGKSAAGDVYISGGVQAPLDRALRFKDLLDKCNNEVIPVTGEAVPGRETGLQILVASAASTAIYLGGPYKTLMGSLLELASGADGFDWRILPIENFQDYQVVGNKIGNVVMMPVIGTLRDSVVFEYGTGKSNIIEYTRAVARDTQANKVYHNAAVGPDAPGFPTKYAFNTASAAYYKLMEDIAEADLVDATLRQQLVNEHVAVRSYPRQSINFTPVNSLHDTVPRFGEDFDIGDTVEGRAVYKNTVRFDALARVWGATFQIDNNGAETMTLQLSEEGAS
jgi:hypothetical protein